MLGSHIKLLAAIRSLCLEWTELSRPLVGDEVDTERHGLGNEVPAGRRGITAVPNSVHECVCACECEYTRVRVWCCVCFVLEVFPGGLRWGTVF